MENMLSLINRKLSPTEKWIMKFKYHRNYLIKVHIMQKIKPNYDDIAML